MNLRTMSLLVIMSVTVAGGLAHATLMNTEWDGATYNWDEYDDRLARNYAKPFNEALGSSIKVSFDHKSYDEHFAAEKAKKRIADRDNLSPDNHADTALSGFWQGMNAYPSGAFPLDCKKCIDEVKAKVKKVVLRYDEKIQGYKMDLQTDGTLTIAVKSNCQTHSYGWIQTPLNKLFPTLKDYWDAHH